MEDKNYPGFDVNPMRTAYEYEYLSPKTLMKLFDAGFCSVEDLHNIQIDMLPTQAGLTEEECREVEQMQLLCTKPRSE